MDVLLRTEENDVTKRMPGVENVRMSYPLRRDWTLEDEDALSEALGVVVPQVEHLRSSAESDEWAQVYINIDARKDMSEHLVSIVGGRSLLSDMTPDVICAFLSPYKFPESHVRTEEVPLCLSMSRSGDLLLHIVHGDERGKLRSMYVCP